LELDVGGLDFRLVCVYFVLPFDDDDDDDGGAVSFCWTWVGINKSMDIIVSIPVNA
jgi:hypothetical protein